MSKIRASYFLEIMLSGTERCRKGCGKKSKKNTIPR
jgi:hypothetical protein